ncbi:hypothetical protein Dimus_020690, partial [Dionaea muscipula]
MVGEPGGSVVLVAVRVWVRLVASGSVVSCMGKRRKAKGTPRGLGGVSGGCGDGSGGCDGGSVGCGGFSLRRGDGDRLGDGCVGGVDGSERGGGDGGGRSVSGSSGLGVSLADGVPPLMTGAASGVVDVLQAAGVPSLARGSAPVAGSGLPVSGSVTGSATEHGPCFVPVASPDGDGRPAARDDDGYALGRMMAGSYMEMAMGCHCREDMGLQKEPGVMVHGFGKLGLTADVGLGTSLGPVMAEAKVSHGQGSRLHGMPVMGLSKGICDLGRDDGPEVVHFDGLGVAHSESAGIH